MVRNAGSTEDDDPHPVSPSIGFLKVCVAGIPSVNRADEKSNNRVNVALSRAKHGMYIMGHAEQLASQSPMWETIVDQLVESESIGTGWPIACANHPETLRYVDQPGQIQLISPDGTSNIVCSAPADDKAVVCLDGKCLMTCYGSELTHSGQAMQCGHICEQKVVNTYAFADYSVIQMIKSMPSSNVTSHVADSCSHVNILASSGALKIVVHVSRSCTMWNFLVVTRWIFHGV